LCSLLLSASVRRPQNCQPSYTIVEIRSEQEREVQK
jgi:hypothetical protein